VLERLAPVQVVPVALRIEPLNTMSPHAFVLAGDPDKQLFIGDDAANRLIDQPMRGPWHI
jgi:hypothetical protein